MIDDNSDSAGRRYCQIRSWKSTPHGLYNLPRVSYKPLPDRCIRVIELQPGKRVEPFRARFIVGSLDEPFEYDALSYMWGDASPFDCIIVDGAPLPIAWNLARALEYLREHMNPDPLRIWIDAICINQQDDNERAIQVGLMRLLYRNANHVRIWINEPDLDEHSKALAALRAFRLQGRSEFGLGDDSGFWNPILPILKNEYWSRIWILSRHGRQQEVVNARWLILHCMNASMVGTTVFAFRRAIKLRIYQRIRSRDIAHYTTMDGKNPAPMAEEIFALHGEARRRYKLIELLHGKRGLLVSRDHDRLYAIMHLAQDYQDGDITVDYNKSLEQVMLDVATHHISRHHDLEFLLQSFQPSADDLDSCESLARPSWILNCWLGKEVFGIATAGQKKMFSQCCQKSIDLSTMRLRVRGIKIDKLRQLFKLWHDVWKLTVVQFWASPLGQYLQPYMSDNAARLPPEIYWAIAGQDQFIKISSGHLKAGLTYLHELNQVSELADTMIVAEENVLLPGWSQTTHVSMQQFLMLIGSNNFALTDKGFFGLIPDCNVRHSDEIWLILGCPLPIFVRQRDDGAYAHVCAAKIPRLPNFLKKHGDFRKFTMETQPGEKIGEWTMEDIEIA